MAAPRFLRRHGVFHLRRRVIFIMFGQHLLGGNMPLAVQYALGHHALPFTKQVRQNALIADVHHPAGVIQLKAHVEGLRVALQEPG